MERKNYRNTDPETSKEAGESVTESNNAKRYNQIIEAIKICNKPLHTDALDAYYGVPNNTFSRRAKEAESKKLIYRTTIKEKTRAGKNAFCWDLWENKPTETEIPKHENVVEEKIVVKKPKQAAIFVQADMFIK